MNKKFCLLLCSLMPTFGLLQSVAAGPYSGEVRFSFNTYSWERSIEGLYFRNGDEEETEVSVANGSPSEAYEYQGSAPLQFYRKSGGSETVVAQFTPESSDRQLLIFVRQEEGSLLEYQVHSIPFEESKSGSDIYRFVNLTNHPIYVGFGNEVYAIKVGGEEAVNMSEIELDSNSVTMRIKLDNGKNEGHMEYSSSWSIRSGRSAFVFMTVRPGSDDLLKIERLYY